MKECRSGRIIETTRKGKLYYYMRLNLIDPDNAANPYSTKDIPTNLLATKRNFSKANALLDDAITEYSADADKMYFHNYCKHWLETKKPSLEVGTYESYEYRMNNIISFFREKKILLAELKPEHINEFYNHLLTVEHGVRRLYGAVSCWTITLPYTISDPPV